MIEQTPPNPKKWPLTALTNIAGVALGIFTTGLLIISFVIIMTYPNLPALNALTDYQPKIPLRIFSSDNVLIGEFGEERRDVIRIKDTPDIIKKAILTAEDDNFYAHGGIDYLGILRAALHNLTGGAKQGASTITQQVARNFFLSNEQTLKRKIYEILLAWKIEHNLSKDQILEIYMNQIYLGQHAFGFSSAAQIYFGKKLSEINVAEAAMLAGLPKAPSAYNPVANPKRAKIRQQHILLRMHQLGYLSNKAYEDAKNQPLKIKTDSTEFSVHAEYVAEIARQLVYEQFKEDTYTKGISVFTTISKADQDAAYLAVRQGVMEYEKRHGYRGPEGFVNSSNTKEEFENNLETAFADHPNSDDIITAIVLSSSPQKVQAVLASGEEIQIYGDGLKFANTALNNNTPSNKKITRGAIIRVNKGSESAWNITQMPEVESAFIAANTKDGAIRAMVGGFDFSKNKFNHVTQAWRQPGSSFKPFIYSAALEKGFSPATIINDAPISFGGSETGGQAWEPKNYDGKYEGPISVRKGLAKSKNMVSVRILNKIGAKYGQEYVTRFGFDADKNPAYLTLALGAGATTPLQMVGAYAVFANGGYKINPHLIAKITDKSGKIISKVTPNQANDEANRVIDERNAFIMDNMLKDVIKYGTATKALALKRSDLAGKTGTTNDSFDAWFAGYQPGIVAVAWIGFDQPKNLGNRETGGGLALPIWVNYMQKILKTVPIQERSVPEGILQVGTEYYYSENPPGAGIHSLGVGDAHPAQKNDAAHEVVKEP